MTQYSRRLNVVLARILRKFNGSRRYQGPSAFSLIGILFITLFAAAGSGAAAQEHFFSPPDASQFIEPGNAPDGPVVDGPAIADPAPMQAVGDNAVPEMDGDTGDGVPATLAAMVLQQDGSDLSSEMSCLAGAIYFEARGESLAGQLAVGRVIVARAQSGRFPESYCGVVYQHAQFSFIHGNAMPGFNHETPSWRNAVAIARIANAGSWQSPAEGALFFHAARVAPGWHLKRVAQIDNHIFYR